MTSPAARQLVRRTCAAQGLPKRLADAIVAAEVAALLRPAPAPPAGPKREVSRA